MGAAFSRLVFADIKLLESNLVSGKRFMASVNPTGTKASAAVLFTATSAHQCPRYPPHISASPSHMPKAAAAAVAAAQPQPELK